MEKITNGNGTKKAFFTITTTVISAVIIAVLGGLFAVYISYTDIADYQSDQKEERKIEMAEREEMRGEIIELRLRVQEWAGMAKINSEAIVEMKADLKALERYIYNTKEYQKTNP